MQLSISYVIAEILLFCLTTSAYVPFFCRVSSTLLAPSQQPFLTNVPESSARIQYLFSKLCKSFSWFDFGKEYKDAQQAYSLINQKWPVVTNLDIQRYSSRVMQRLIAVSPESSFPWTTRVIRESTLSSMNSERGVILINSELFEYLGSEAQLAYVIAHEMGHQLKQHLTTIQTRKKIDRLIVLSAAVIPAGASYREVAEAINTLESPAVRASLPSFNWDQKIEADQIGLHLVYESGYDPREAEKVVSKLIELESLHGQDITLFSTHPDPQARLSTIQSWISSLGNRSFSDRIVTTKEFTEFKDLYQY